MAHLRTAVDTEYQPVTDKPTIPLSVQVKVDNYEEKLYLHPKAPLPVVERELQFFKTPFALLDYFQDVCGYEWSLMDVAASPKNYLVAKTFIFFSFKDIEFLFADVEDYKNLVLKKLERTRRIRTDKSIALPWLVKCPDKNGNLRWHRLSLDIIDICAMQGAEGLHSYATNVGITMSAKTTYTSEQKGSMLKQLALDSDKFTTYALGDTPLTDIYDKTNDFYNQVASVLGLAPRECWGLSTGKVVAGMLSEWVSMQTGIPLEKLYLVTSVAGTKGITDLSQFVRDKRLLYTSMVDGGRAVKERDVEASITGVLDDIDISGCYGNGLRNQGIAIGHPTVETEPMNLGSFLKKYKRQLIPGHWYARVSYANAPFKQDILLSKVEEKFTSWENATVEMQEDGERYYDAAMVLLTNSCVQAALTHDLLQVLKEYSSNHEYSWLLENCIVETSLVYEKKHQLDKPTPAMMEGIKVGSKADVLVKKPTGWVNVDLASFVTPLLEERSKHPKGTPLNAFYKLIINTTYGVIASAFFSEKGYGCSHVVAGNNITARARTLAWCMAKGLHSHMSVTDGGVFDVNKVLTFKKTSLSLLEGLHRDLLTDTSRHTWAVQKPLFEEPIAEVTDFSELDKTAWQHLKSVFGKLDIFKDDQFSFESKKWYQKLTLHSKVDYRLVGGNGGTKIALRGLPKKATVEGIPSEVLANRLFDAIELDEPTMVEGNFTQLLSLSDYQMLKDTPLLPHDEVTDRKRFYSHSPLKHRFTDMSQYKKMLKAYEQAKATGDAFEVAKVKPE